MRARRSFLVFLGFRLFSRVYSWLFLSRSENDSRWTKNLPNFVNLDCFKKSSELEMCASHVKENHHQMIQKWPFYTRFEGSPLQPLSSGHFTIPKKGHVVGRLDRAIYTFYDATLFLKNVRDVIWKLCASIINHPQNKYISGQIRPTIPFNLNLSGHFWGDSREQSPPFGGNSQPAGWSL